jgi:hypothetical protein
LKEIKMFGFPLKNTPAPAGFQIKVDGVILSKVYETEDAAFDAAEAKGLVDYRIVEV